MKILLLGDTQKNAPLVQKLRASALSAHFLAYRPDDATLLPATSTALPAPWQRARHAEAAARFASAHRVDMAIALDEGFDAQQLALAMGARGIALFTGSMPGSGEIKPSARAPWRALPLQEHRRADSLEAVTAWGEELIAQYGAALCHVGQLSPFSQACLLRSRAELSLFAHRLAEAAAINKRTPAVYLEPPHEGVTYFYFAFHAGRQVCGAAFCQPPGLASQNLCGPAAEDAWGGVRACPRLFPMPARDTERIEGLFIKPLLASWPRTASPGNGAPSERGWFLLRIQWTSLGPRLHSFHQSFAPADVRALAEADGRDWLALMLGFDGNATGDHRENQVRPHWQGISVA